MRPQSIRLCEHDARSALFGLFRQLMGHHHEEITAKCGNIMLLRVSRELDKPAPICVNYSKATTHKEATEE